MKIKKLWKLVLYPLVFLGFNIASVKSLRYVPKYIKNLIDYKAIGPIDFYYPILSDYSDQAGSTKGQYFYQDLLVAQYIFNASPRRHIDIGSRIDGFVAHVAAFRKIEVMDIRALDPLGIENIEFIQSDLMKPNSLVNVTDSISCLHAIEHFGLGRYGDDLNPTGHIQGFQNIIKMVEPGGSIYISFPIGKKNLTCFNAHRIFNPIDIFNWDLNNVLILESFDYLSASGELFRNVNPYDLSDVLNIDGLGIYRFKK